VKNHLHKKGQMGGRFFLKEAFGFPVQTMTTRSVYDILEQAVVHFELQEKSPAHLTFFMQVVFDHQQKNGPDIFSFLQHWEDKKSSLAISAPEKADAVTLMTIHKSKGLEFPVVLFPYADTPIIDKRKKKKIWVRASSKTESLGLSEYLLSYSENMLHFDDASKAAYEKESAQIQLDAVNVLYVALTRAEQALFVLSEIPRKDLGPEHANSYSELLYGYANTSAMTEVDENRYALGSLENNTERTKAENTLDDVLYSSRSKNAPSFRISTKSGQLWNTPQQSALDTGTLLHEILSRVRYDDALETTFTRMQEAGLFGKDEHETLWKKVEATVHHPLLTKYFTKEFQVFTEKEILLHNGNSIRPDRIALSGMKATILEYKTGKHDTNHVAQIQGYAQALQSMGYTIENTILIYINEEVQPLFL
ncbi:MAG: 3'-5' exonuclease, partial [Bacteroidota bacterium]